MEFGSKYLRVVSSVFNFSSSSVFFSIFPLSLFSFPLLFHPSSFQTLSVPPSLLFPPSLPLSHTHKLQTDSHSASGSMLGFEESELRSRLFHHRAHSARKKGLNQAAAHCTGSLPPESCTGEYVSIEGEPATQPEGCKIEE